MKPQNLNMAFQIALPIDRFAGCHHCYTQDMWDDLSTCVAEPPPFYNSTSVSVLVVSYVLLASLHLNWAEGSTP